MTVPLKPLGDRVIAVREEAQTKTASGILLPDVAQEKSALAKVLAVGPKVTSLKASDTILYKDYAVTEVSVAGSDYLVIREEDILATVGK